MLCGLPASGKSLYAQDIHNSTGATIFSSDAIRLELFGNENEQRYQDKVFETLHRRVKEVLLNGSDAVYDATNISYKRRMTFLQEIKNILCKKVCIVMATPYQECLRRNSDRLRSVPEHVIERMIKGFWVPQLYEGWDEIEIIQSEKRDIDTLFNIGDDNSPMPLIQVEQDNPHHNLTVGHHCLACMNYIGLGCFDAPRELFRAAKMHDIGKPFTKSFVNSRGETTDIAHYYNHHNVSAYMSLNYTDSQYEDPLVIANLIQWHMRPFEIKRSENPEKLKDKLWELVGDETYTYIMILHDADISTKGDK